MNKSYSRKLRWMMQSAYDWINRGNYTPIPSSYFSRKIGYQNQRTTCCIYRSLFLFQTYFLLSPSLFPIIYYSMMLFVIAAHYFLVLLCTWETVGLTCLKRLSYRNDKTSRNIIFVLECSYAYPSFVSKYLRGL